MPQTAYHQVLLAPTPPTKAWNKAQESWLPSSLHCTLVCTLFSETQGSHFPSTSSSIPFSPVSSQRLEGTKGVEASSVSFNTPPINCLCHSMVTAGSLCTKKGLALPSAQPGVKCILGPITELVSPTPHACSGVSLNQSSFASHALPSVLFLETLLVSNRPPHLFCRFPCQPLTVWAGGAVSANRACPFVPYSASAFPYLPGHWCSPQH